MRLAVTLVLAALMAVGTRLVGWWAVPALAALAALLAALLPSPGRPSASATAAAAALGWGALLVADLAGAGGRALLPLLSGVLHAPAAVALAATLALAAALAWGAAAAVEELRALAGRRPVVVAPVAAPADGPHPAVSAAPRAEAGGTT